MSDFEVTQFLFDAYKSCPDTEFVSYMKRLEDRHNDPDDTLTFEPTGLLTRADTFYENAIAREQWMKKTADQQDIVALQASVARLQSALKKQKTPATTPRQVTRMAKARRRLRRSPTLESDRTDAQTSRARKHGSWWHPSLVSSTRRQLEVKNSSTAPIIVTGQAT